MTGMICVCMCMYLCMYKDTVYIYTYLYLTVFVFTVNEPLFRDSGLVEVRCEAFDLRPISTHNQRGLVSRL